jgi:hypothetical protein
MFEIEVQVIRLVKAFNPQMTSLLSLRNHSLHKKIKQKINRKALHDWGYKHIKVFYKEVYNIHNTLYPNLDAI